MSQDLFAAFQHPPPAPQHLPPPHSSHQAANAAPATEHEDDFGDFEDASAAATAKREAARPESLTIPPRLAPATSPSNPFPPAPQQRQEAPRPSSHSKVGRHPFADHMDFLFAGGDDEYDAGHDDLQDLSKNPEAAMAYSKRTIAEQEAKSMMNTSLPFSSTPNPPSTSNPPPSRNRLQKRSGYVPSRDSHILFDVENLSEHESGDDDFGDFEGDPNAKAAVAPKPSPAKLQKKSGPPPSAKIQKDGTKPAMPAIDLLGLSHPVMSPTVNFNQQHMAHNTIMSPRSQRAVSIPGVSKADTVPRPPAAGNLYPAEDEAWDDFDTAEVPSGPVAHHSHSRTASSSILPPDLTPATGRSRSNTPQDSLAPTNIPPPALLLATFTSIFSAGQDVLLGNLAKLDTAQRQQLLTHPATHKFFETYLSDGIVLAHIVAGRKLRWKRDQTLFQSMRIGPAVAGGKGGMKLNSIDKSEQTKEDREVTDVVGQWKAQVGKLRAAVTGANAATSKLPAVPEIADTMAVKTLKAIDGGFTAPHACALCGLKREERVHKVDVDINDSFGEWWVSGIDMHVTCKRWWEQNKSKLKSR